MELDPKIESDGLKWIMRAGFVALLVSSFLVWVDHTLSTSDTDERLAETLYELRTAQSSLGTGSIDERLAEPNGNQHSREESVDLAAH